MMKPFYLVIFLIMIFFAFESCRQKQNSDRNSSVLSNDLKVGGIYILQNENKSFYLTKILAIDDYAIHLRTYMDTFPVRPVDINSDTLEIMIGHAPLDKNGFLIDKPELLKVEKVKESELEGYKLYLEEMAK